MFNVTFCSAGQTS